MLLLRKPLEEPHSDDDSNPQTNTLPIFSMPAPSMECVPTVAHSRYPGFVDKSWFWRENCSKKNPDRIFVYFVSFEESVGFSELDRSGSLFKAKRRHTAMTFGGFISRYGIFYVCILVLEAVSSEVRLGTWNTEN